MPAPLWGRVNRGQKCWVRGGQLLSSVCVVVIKLKEEREREGEGMMEGRWE